jgi:hypothetical protein
VAQRAGLSNSADTEVSQSHEKRRISIDSARLRNPKRFVSEANPARLRFTLISGDGRLETAFELDRNARCSFPN